MNEYEELRKVIVEEAGIPETTKLKAMGYQMTVRDYIRAVSERGGAARILMALKSMDTKERVMPFLQGAATGIINHYNNNEPGYREYYKNVLKKAR